FRRVLFRSIIALNALTIGQIRFEGSEHLQASIAVILASAGKERPEIASSLADARLGILLKGIRVKEEEDARTLAVERVRVNALIGIERPEIEIAFERGVMGAAVEREQAGGGLA